MQELDILLLEALGTDFKTLPILEASCLLPFARESVASSLFITKYLHVLVSFSFLYSLDVILSLLLLSFSCILLILSLARNSLQSILTSFQRSLPRFLLSLSFFSLYLLLASFLAFASFKGSWSLFSAFENHVGIMKTSF
jgi:hypothetical protein